MAKNDNVKNQDILYLIGRTRQIDLLKKIEDQISNIELIIDNNIISKEDVIVKLPVKWFFDDLKVSLTYNKETIEPESIDSNETDKAVYCKFDSVIDEDNFYDNSEPVIFILGLLHPSYPMDVIFQAQVNEKSVKSMGGKISDNKYTPKWMKNKMKDYELTDNKTTKELQITMKEIKASKKTFTLDNGILAEK